MKGNVMSSVSYCVMSQLVIMLNNCDLNIESNSPDCYFFSINEES